MATPGFMDAVRDEMAAAKDGYIGMLGEMLTEYIRLHPDQPAPEGKTLKGAFDRLREAARKKAKGGAYAMPPQEAFDLLMDYYGMTPAADDFGRVMTAVLGLGAPAAAPEARKTREPAADPFDLDALLGE